MDREISDMQRHNENMEWIADQWGREYYAYLEDARQALDMKNRNLLKESLIDVIACAIMLCRDAFYNDIQSEKLYLNLGDLFNDGISLHREEEIYWNFCYSIHEMVFEAVRRAYPGGFSYNEFIDIIFQKNGIDLSDGQKEHFVNTVKKDISDTNKRRGDYLKSIIAYRMNHDAVKDKNINSGEYIFQPIGEYELAAYEFQFYLKKRNRSNKIDEDLLKQIQEISFGKLEKYFGENTEYYCNKYKKLCKKVISEMSAVELNVYIEIINAEVSFICQEEQEKFRSMGEYQIYKGIKCYYDVETGRFYNRAPDFLNLATQALIACIANIYDGKDTTAQMFLWDTVIQIGNQAHKLLETIGIFEDIQKMLTSTVLKALWRDALIFSSEDVESKLRFDFLAKLKKNNSKVDEFIHLIFWCHWKECDDREVKEIKAAIIINFISIF